MWKFQDFTVTQILRELNMAMFKPQKSAILSILAAGNFGFIGIFDIFKCENYQKIKIQSLQKL